MSCCFLSYSLFQSVQLKLPIFEELIFRIAFLSLKI